jgi:hypothetical protein
MTQEELQQAIQSKQVEIQTPQPTPDTPSTPQDSSSMDEFLAILFLARRYRRHLTTAPTFKPKTFLDQIQLYDDGTNRRAYFYINNTWRYTALT